MKDQIFEINEITLHLMLIEIFFFFLNGNVDRDLCIKIVIPEYDRNFKSNESRDQQVRIENAFLHTSQ